MRAILRRFYGRCDALVAPAESTAAILRAQRMNRDISIWARGIDRAQFNPERRSLAFRAAHGIGKDEVVVAFLGRLVLEKGLDVFADAIDAATPQGSEAQGPGDWRRAGARRGSRAACPTRSSPAN